MLPMPRIIKLVAAAALALLAAAQVLAQPVPTGVVIMHGKGGSPTRLVFDLAAALEARGFRVMNLEMPWAGRRNYDVDVARAEAEVEAVVTDLRARTGVDKVFVAGHSQGGLFALHLAGRLAVDGVIAIAPGGSVSSRLFREKLGDSLDRARRLVAEGKGSEPAALEDFEGARGTYRVDAVPAAYVTWFDPDGAMNIERAARAVKAQVPILYIAPSRDYPGLRRAHPAVFRLLPSNPRTRLYEPDADHRGAPTASADEIARWMAEVAGGAPR